jgi:ADP-ribose pyrophosphatase YjhB (NUDIX family)
MVGGDGELPAGPVELESTIRGTAEGLLDELDMPPRTRLELVDVRTGPGWFEEHPEVGPLQPIWVILSADPSARLDPLGLLAPTARPRPTRPAHELALVSVPPERPVLVDRPPGGATPGPGAYITGIRARIGHDRIFYPWAGLAIRDGDGKLFLVRLAEREQWHCPGGGMEIGETPAGAALRELAEETGLVAGPGRLIGCYSRHLTSFANGDLIHAIAMLYEAELQGGTLRPDTTDEIDQTGWFGRRDLPPLRPPWDERVRLVLTGRGQRFD